MVNSVFEPNETLFANIIFSVDVLSGVILAPALAVVTILDDDGISIISDCYLINSIVGLCKSSG